MKTPKKKTFIILLKLIIFKIKINTWNQQLQF
jgi:hypothetical protein